MEKTIFRKTRKDANWPTTRSYAVRYYLRQIWKYKEISRSPHAACQWRILTSDFPWHGLSPNRNEYGSWHAVDTSRVLEHGTSGYVRILEEYGSVSCDFRTTILLISHSVALRRLEIVFIFPRLVLQILFQLQFSLSYQCEIYQRLKWNVIESLHHIFSENLLPWQRYNAFSCTPKIESYRVIKRTGRWNLLKLLYYMLLGMIVKICNFKKIL